MPETRRFIAAKEAKPPLFAGIDLGGTNIKVGVVDDLGRPLSWLSMPTEIERGPEDAARAHGRRPCSTRSPRPGWRPRPLPASGSARPAPWTSPPACCSQPVNLKGWDNFPIRDRVSHHCGLPVTFANDANAAAYGEFWVGSGRDFHSMVLFTLGTGIGCGIIIGDMVVGGEHSHGGECGHIIIDFDDDARMCGCGQRGHLEAYASATAVIKRTAGGPGGRTHQLAVERGSRPARS